MFLHMHHHTSFFFFFFFNDTATTEIYTLSLHDALPISDSIQRVLFRTIALRIVSSFRAQAMSATFFGFPAAKKVALIACADRKSTRLNSSHSQISYAVFCLKKKKK